MAIECLSCEYRMDDNAKKCPKCGAPVPQNGFLAPNYKIGKVVLWIVIAISAAFELYVNLIIGGFLLK